MGLALKKKKKTKKKLQWERVPKYLLPSSPHGLKYYLAMVLACTPQADKPFTYPTLREEPRVSLRDISGLMDGGAEPRSWSDTPPSVELSRAGRGGSLGAGGYQPARWGN